MEPSQSTSEQDPATSAGGDGILWQSLTGDFPLASEPHARGQPHAVDIPNAALRESSGGRTLGDFYAIGEAWAQLAAFFATNDAPRILDIGCGCGKMARFFLINPRVRYIGLDVFPPAISWCQKAFEQFPRFRFEHLDIASPVYNPAGKIDPGEAILPVETGAVDFVICGSLFTHLPEPAFLHYLKEITRVLGGEGKALVSIHDQPEGERISGSEARIDMERSFFVEAVEESGLQVKMHLGTVYGQQVYLLHKP